MLTRRDFNPVHVESRVLPMAGMFLITFHRGDEPAAEKKSSYMSSFLLKVVIFTDRNNNTYWNLLSDCFHLNMLLWDFALQWQSKDIKGDIYKNNLNQEVLFQQFFFSWFSLKTCRGAWQTPSLCWVFFIFFIIIHFKSKFEVEIFLMDHIYGPFLTPLSRTDFPRV